MKAVLFACGCFGGELTAPFLQRAVSLYDELHRTGAVVETVLPSCGAEVPWSNQTSSPIYAIAPAKYYREAVTPLLAYSELAYVLFAPESPRQVRNLEQISDLCQSLKKTFYLFAVRAELPCPTSGGHGSS